MEDVFYEIYFPAKAEGNTGVCEDDEIFIKFESRDYVVSQEEIEDNEWISW